jgi:hypothetical protein
VAKNPSRFTLCGSLFGGHFSLLSGYGRRGSFSAMPSMITRQDPAIRLR